MSAVSIVFSICDYGSSSYLSSRLHCGEETEKDSDMADISVLILPHVGDYTLGGEPFLINRAFFHVLIPIAKLNHYFYFYLAGSLVDDNP